MDPVIRGAGRPRSAHGALGLVFALASLPSQAAAPPHPKPSSPASSRARLAVMVSVDGLSWARLSGYRPWYVGGLKRLLDEGLVFTACRYRHLNTETGPGHASLGTGAPPRVTGIVANRWFETNPDGSLRAMYCTDQAAPAVPGSPPLFYREIEKDGRLYVFARRHELEVWQQSGEPGRSVVRMGYGPGGQAVVFDSEDAIRLYNFKSGKPEEAVRNGESMPGPGNLRVPTLGDRLVESRPGARVVSIAGKDRAAIFLAGRDPRHAAYWFSREDGRFVSSAAYDTASPSGQAARAIVGRFNEARMGPALPGRVGLLWKRLSAPPPNDPNLPRPAPNMLDFQIPVNGLGFDHDVSLNPEGYFEGIYTSPAIDELVADLALAFLAEPAFKLGDGPEPDLLSLSFSAQDTVSHNYGPESEENLDVLRRLDLQLGRVLDALERRYPKGSVVLGLSADHGFLPIPEAEAKRDASFTGGRLVVGERGINPFVDRLNRALDQELCLDPSSRPIHALEGWNLAYNRPAFPMRTAEGPCGAAGRVVAAADVDAILPRILDRLFNEEIQGVLLVSQRDRWPATDPAVDFARNDLDLERSGDALIIPRPGALVHRDPGRGSGHGSHYEYDTHVPLILWGGGLGPGTSDEDAAPYDLAPTLGELLGVSVPDAVGRSRVPRK